jgi:hypothetical protein
MNRRYQRQRDEHVWQEIVMDTEFDDDAHADLARQAMGLPPLYTKVNRVTRYEVAAIIVILLVLIVATVHSVKGAA